MLFDSMSGLGQDVHTGTGILILGVACILNPLTDWEAIWVARMG